jgi:hypothetical protein
MALRPWLLRVHVDGGNCPMNRHLEVLSTIANPKCGPDSGEGAMSSRRVRVFAVGIA